MLNTVFPDFSYNNQTKITYLFNLAKKTSMTNPRSYRPFSSCPHTYGVRPWSSLAIATEPCRPTACVHERPCPHNGQGGRGETLSYRASAPNGAGDVGSRSTVHCSLLTVHWSFTFSAKEKDPETGLSYFGSRYYSSDLSIWLSVDPMSGKYASLSPYVYCADNPVKLVDPNGDSIINPYKRLIEERKAAIIELEKGIKGQKYNYPNLARAALETTKFELKEYTERSRTAMPMPPITVDMSLAIPPV